MDKEVKEDLDINKSSRNIVIIGNGFDMSLGLKSSYQDFIKYIKHKKKFAQDYELYNYNRLFLRKYENFHLNWSDFESLYEETIRKINNRSQKNEEPQDILDIVSINNAIRRLEEDFNEYLLEEYPKWVEQRTIPIGTSSETYNYKRFTENINPFFEKLIKDENTYFVNFNYTNSMEDLCESVIYDPLEINQSRLNLKKAKDRIFHIHGSLKEGNILFGGGFTDSEDINRIHYSQSLINDKLFRIKENELLNTTRKNIMSVIDLSSNDTKNDLFIIGHSLQGSDFPFLSKLIKKANKVFIFYYEDDYIFKMEEILRKFGSAVAEKIVLVPFLEVLLQSDKSIISSYKEYQKIDSFFPNKFPREGILSELTLTIDHFSFRNINELRISSDNVEKILQIARNLVINKNNSRISQIYFEESIDAAEFKKLSNSEDFLILLKWVKKVYFSNTEIDSDFFIQLLENGSNLAYIKMEYCTLVNGDNESADVSICESLKRLEMVKCSFTSERKSKFYIKSDKQNNIEKLTLLENTNIVIEKNVLEKSTNLTEINILIADDKNVYSEELHLENLEILQIDYSSGLVPSLTVGTKIEEIILLGYPDEFIKLSSFMKSNEDSVGFPKLRVFHLKLPDQMTSCQDLIVDVILDVFSNNTKFIVDKDIKSIKEYYLEYKEPHIKTFNHFEEYIDNNILLKFKNLSLELSKLKKESIIEELLEEMSIKLEEKIRTIGQMESKEINESNKKNESDSEKGIGTNKIDTPINTLLYAYAAGDKAASSELIKTLEEQNKTKTVIDVYREILTKIEHTKLISNVEILSLKNEFFTQARNKIIKDFSEEWFVSKEALDLSAVQYVDGAEDIPNIGGIIDSINYKSYKDKHSDVKPIKYAQAIKQGWQKELDQEIVYLNNELK